MNLIHLKSIFDTYINLLDMFDSRFIFELTLPFWVKFPSNSSIYLHLFVIIFTARWHKNVNSWLAFFEMHYFTLGRWLDIDLIFIWFVSLRFKPTFNSAGNRFLPQGLGCMNSWVFLRFSYYFKVFARFVPTSLLQIIRVTLRILEKNNARHPFLSFSTTRRRTMTRKF